MTILLTGGTGKIGIKLARLLKNANVPVLIAARSPSKVPESFQSVHFDWLDSSTFENPFKADPGIDKVYLVVPPAWDGPHIVKSFIDLAIAKGVKRFVLVSATDFPKGTRPAGLVHEYLIEKGVDYCVMRPSWFMDNFAARFLPDIRDRDIIVSAAGDGRMPFISADDIADVAFKALTDEQSHNTDHIIVGPELYSYGEAAAILSQVLGRKITHKVVSVEDSKHIFQTWGAPDELASALANLEKFIEEGKEEQFFHEPVKIVGKKHLKEYFTDNRELWIPKTV